MATGLPAGPVVHGVGEEGTRTRDIAGQHGRRQQPQTHVGPGRQTGPHVAELQVLPWPDSGKRIQLFGENPWVEVAGIEPASFDARPGLLRAQFAVPLLGPTAHANKSV
jgi:hypothetical protein